MLYFANWKILLICGVCALGVLFSLPNLFTPAQLACLPNAIPHKQVALGLDLRGGSYLLLEVDMSRGAEGAAQHARRRACATRCATRKIGYTGLEVEGDRDRLHACASPAAIEDARAALAEDRSRSRR